jgi:hypothetical protein
MVTVNKKQASVLALVAIFASIMVVGPVASNSAFAHSDDFWKRFFDNDDNNGGNSADQEISQSQESEQDSFVVSGDDTDDSGNNLNAQFQFNDGNNALGQQDNDEED